jgi:aminotransferase EvaB
MSIYVWSYLKEYAQEKEEVLAAIEKVLDSGTLVFGESLKTFEKQFSKYCDSQFGVGVGTCTDALTLSLRAIGINRGDEVITVSNTAIPTVSAIVQAGAVPVFVDVKEDDFLMDLDLVEKAITSKTKCIMVVHLFGQCVDMDRVEQIAKKHGLKVVEDCAQAHGSTYKGRKAGSMSDVSAFSFYPTKTLGTYGDGGIIITNKEEIYESLLALRFYGISNYSKPAVDRKYYAETHGYNSRLDEIHAAILIGKLGHLEEYIEKRRKLAEVYTSELSNTSLILPVENVDNRHTYYVYVVRHTDRKRIMDKLVENDIHVNISYPYPVHLMNGYQYLGYKDGSLPITEKLADEIFSLPMYPTLSCEEQKFVIDVLKEHA